MDFSVSTEIGPRWIILLAGLGIIISFAAGLSNSIMFYEFLPRDENAEILVFYQPTCPHCIAEIPTIRRLAAEGYSVSAFNVFKRPDLAEKYGIIATPTIVITKNGVKLEGEQSYEAIIAAINGTTNPWGSTGAACSVSEVETCSPT